MTIHTFPLGAHLKVHSLNATPPQDRAAPDPPYLIVLCHGVTLQGNATIQVPGNIPPLRFAVPHGVAHEIDRQWFESLIKDGVSLEYDFKYPVAAGEAVDNYFLGKGSPDLSKGATPREWLGYDKASRLPKPYAYNSRSIAAVEVLSTSYAKNAMLYGETISKPPGFDFATLRRSCQNLGDLFQSVATAPAHAAYSQLLCAFCREFADQ